MSATNNHTAAGTLPELPHSFAASPLFREARDILCEQYADKLDTIQVEQLVVGVFFVGITFTNGCSGIAYTPPELINRASCQLLRNDWDRFRGMTVRHLLTETLRSPFTDVILLASLNALSVPIFKQGGYDVLDCDLAGIPALFTGRRVCIVGAIIPLLRKMKEMQPASVAIIDKKKETQEEAEAGYGTFCDPSRLPELLQQCDTAVFTGASVANGSIDELLRHTRDDALIAIVGPSAAFVPEPLFARRVAFLGTSIVADGETALEILGEGGGAYQLFHSCMEKITLVNQARLQQLGLGQICP